MSGSKTRQIFAVVVAVAVVWSVAGVPVAAAAIDTDSDSGLTGLSSGSQSADGSTENETTAGDGDTDEGDEDSTESSDDAGDGEDADETEDGTNDGDGSTTNETDDTDDSGDDSSGDDSTLRRDSSDDPDSENGSDDSADDRPTERVEAAVDETVEETTATVENGTGDVRDAGVLALDVDEGTVTEATEEVVENVQLESALGLGVLELVEPLPTGAESVDRTHTYDETVDTNHDEPPTATETATDDGADENETAAVAAVGTSGDEQPDPADPAGAGAVMGLGALATAAALRGSPILVGSKAASSSGWVSNLVDRVRPFVFPLRYSRYDDSDPLEHEARERVYEIVNDTPGSYLSEVSQEAGLPLSTTRHHIKVLEREDLVTGAKLHGKRRFFPAYAEGIELAAALNDDSTASIIDAIARIGTASVSDLADELDRDPSTISHHLQRLEDDGVITRERDGRAVVSKLSAEARTALEPETTPETGEAGEIAAGSAD